MGSPQSDYPPLKQKRYYQLNTFIRALIFHQLKNNPQEKQILKKITQTLAQSKKKL